jgi:hypothetical protein
MRPKQTDTAACDRMFAEAAALDARADFPGAVRLLEAAVVDFPDWPEGLLNLGVAHGRQGDLVRAETVIRRSLALRPNDPVISYNLAAALLKLGQLAEGFALFEARSFIPGLAAPKPSLPYPEWAGEDLAGQRLLIWPDQGFGDQIMYARFVALLVERGAEVTLLCAPGLVRLYAANLKAQVIGASGAIEFPEPDDWVMGLSLAHHLGFTLETLPAAPYLSAPGARLKAPTGIGFVVKGAPRQANDHNRSLTPAAVGDLIEVLGPATHLDPEVTGARDFADTAAIIAELDLVVTVDTSVAHLARAMGKPVWIMLTDVGACWRWMRDAVTARGIRRRGYFVRAGLVTGLPLSRPSSRNWPAGRRSQAIAAGLGFRAQHPAWCA